jgi:hypothetical protein
MKILVIFLFCIGALQAQEIITYPSSIWELNFNSLSRIELPEYKTGYILGKVKVVTENFYSAEENFGETKKNQVERSETYQFDKLGLPVSYTVLFNNSGSDLHKYSYNSKKKISSGELYRNNELSKKLIFKYNTTDKCSERYDYSGSGSLNEKTLYTYNSTGKCVKTQLYKKGDSLADYAEHTYDINNNHIGTYWYTADGKPVTRYINEELFSYDSFGNIIEVIQGIHLYRYKYDSSNRIIECTYRINPEYKDDIMHGKVEKTTYEYNEKGDLIDKTSYDINSKEESYERRSYTYDKKGNWIIKIVHTKDASGVRSIKYIERKIEY